MLLFVKKFVNQKNLFAPFANFRLFYWGLLFKNDLHYMIIAYNI